MSVYPTFLYHILGAGRDVSMEVLVMRLIDLLGSFGALAPLLFIFLHLLRQFLFIPVGLICVLGGLLFGVIFGTIYSIIGITLVSVAFYGIVKRLPKAFSKIIGMKERFFGRRSQLSVGQITILRIVPFVHFHLISLCIIEISSNFKEYTKTSLFTNVPLALLYTAFGSWISKMSLPIILPCLGILMILFYLTRKREWIIKWSEFFQEAS
jgi:uncharacterized membrane protein YdjX (TVP38/TMEM64 family)